MFTDQEIAEVTSGLQESLRERVEAGLRVLPSGFAFYTVSPGTGVPAKRVGTVHGRPFRGRKDLDQFSSAVRTMALAGRAQAAGVAMVADRQIMPSCDFESEEVAIVYLDRLQGRYEVWYAPVMHSSGGTTLGEFTRLDEVQPDVPYVLPIDLYGPIGHA
jgi:hypothetical protein